MDSNQPSTTLLADPMFQNFKITILKQTQSLKQPSWLYPQTHK